MFFLRPSVGKELSVVLQGECGQGYSCLHTAFLLHKSVAALLKNNTKIFVVYLNVRKAFDTVWINGLFHRLFALVIKTWRILYETCMDSICNVRVNDKFSDWYPMSCGIHQGG